MQQQAIMDWKPLRYSYWTVVLVLAALGLTALGVRFALGLKVTDLGSVVPWGFWISFYILFIGLSAGSFLISSLIYAFGVKRYERVGRLAVFFAIICLMMGFLFVLVDLGRPERFWRPFTTLAWTSVMWIEIMLYILYIIVLSVELYFVMRTDLIHLRERSSGLRHWLYRLLSLGSQGLDEAAKERDHKVVRTLAIIGIPVAIGVHGGTGAIFGVVKAIPFWYSPLVPIVFIASAMVSGGGLLLFFRAFFFKPAEDEIDLLSALGKLTLLLILIDWVLILFEFVVGLYGRIPEHTRVFTQIATGSYWWVFWGFQFFLGAVVPAYLIMSSRTGKSRTWLGLAGAAVVLGIVAVRLNIVIPALTIPRIEGMTEVFQSARLATVYFPSLTEWLSTLGLLALVFLAFSAARNLLPLEALEPADSNREA